MGETTGIAWTDSSYNPWIGCTKAGPGCDFCYAEAYDKRAPVSHWGVDVPRRRTAEATRNAPLKWQRGAAKFLAEHGHPRRVFALSLGDWADKEIDPEWRRDMWSIIRQTPDLRYQLCTKRTPLIGKYLPEDWDPKAYSHVGFLITCVNQEEADRDIPRLITLKNEYRLSWIGVSYEPALGGVDWSPWTSTPKGFRAALDRALGEISPREADAAMVKFMQDRVTRADERLDWIIAGGESGPRARDDDLSWYRRTMETCRVCDVPFFMKQMAHLKPIPDDLNVREFPEALL